MAHRKVTIVGSELLGRAGTGGAGTADSLLAVALGRHGHDVEMVVASGREIGALTPEWTQIYEESGVRVRVLEAMRAVTPPYLARSFEVLQALREEPRDVVIANDWRGLAYLPLRARQTGIALTDASFVIHCHGPGRVLTAFAQKVPDTLERFGEDVMERTCIGLADAVVSPSRWLLDWMHDHAWPVADAAEVIQYPRRSAVLDEAPPRSTPGPIRRLAFFGQLREGKGIRIFLDALEQLDPVDVVFLGGASKRWPREELLRRAPHARVENDLTREEALTVLREPGTLAVMPSLLDNSPNTVAECIEQGIPFVAAATGGIPELVAEADRERVLCAPTASALATALRGALAGGVFSPAQPARPPEESIASWLEVVERVTPNPRAGGRRPDAVALIATGWRGAEHARRLAEHTRVTTDVVEVESRRAGLFRTAAEWVVFVDDDDDPDDDMVDRLVAAQVASGADAITCPVRTASGVHLFLGDPGALGLVENQYGVVGLVRASSLLSAKVVDGSRDPDWPMFAALSLAGAKIVSLSEPVADYSGAPGRVDDVPGDAVAVLETFERRASELRDLPQLAATLGAALVPTPLPGSGAQVQPHDGLVRRASRRLRAR